MFNRLILQSLRKTRDTIALEAHTVLNDLAHKLTIHAHGHAPQPRHATTPLRCPSHCRLTVQISARMHHME